MPDRGRGKSSSSLLRSWPSRQDALQVAVDETELHRGDFSRRQPDFVRCGQRQFRRWRVDDHRHFGLGEHVPDFDGEQTNEMLTSAAAEAFRRGAFGVPTFFVGDEMFFGKDRLGQVEEELARG